MASIAKLKGSVRHGLLEEIVDASCAMRVAASFHLLADAAKRSIQLRLAPSARHYRTPFNNLDENCS
jgi:hypothetical protein